MYESQVAASTVAVQEKERLDQDYTMVLNSLSHTYTTVVNFSSEAMLGALDAEEAYKPFASALNIPEEHRTLQVGEPYETHPLSEPSDATNVRQVNSLFGSMRTHRKSPYTILKLMVGVDNETNLDPRGIYVASHRDSDEKTFFKISDSPDAGSPQLKAMPLDPAEQEEVSLELRKAAHVYTTGSTV